MAGRKIVTSNREYQCDVTDALGTSDAAGLTCTVIADMDAADTAYVKINLETGTVLIGGGVVDGNIATFFSGRLLP